MRILAIHAHPDDIELLCAGTLCHLSNLGHDIHMATLSNGDKGTPDKPQEEIANIRKQEAQRSAEVIKGSYTCLDFQDFEIFDDDPSRRKVAEFLRQINPDIVITASPQDYMADHEVTSVLVRNACFIAPCRNYITGKAPIMDKIPVLYYTDPIEGKDAFGNRIQPDFCIDISTVIDTKEKILTCHASQREWLLKHHGIDCYVEAMRAWSQTRGEEFGFAFGEAFRLHKGHAYPQENGLVELFEAEKVRYTQ